MRIVLLQLILVLTFYSLAFPWGEKGHILIGKKAIEYLPEEMKGLKTSSDSIAAHSADPDKRKDTDSTEFPKHFIDIDFYPEFAQGKMLYSYAELISKYTDSTVLDNGILPWVTIETYNKLVESFKSRDKKKTLLYISDLCHYVSDGHQPMHSVMNYDGQKSGQKGIHGRYEIEMVDRHLTELVQLREPFSASKINDVQEFVFNYIEDANAAAPLLFDADNFAFEGAGSRESENYYNLLWFRTKYITNIQINKAAEAIASLIYSGWQKAGKPSFKDFK